MRFAGYIRVSRVGSREGEGYISPALQREAIETYATSMDGEVAAWFTDEDQSGGTVDRPAFAEALAAIRAGRLDGIVVMRIDRFARTVPEGVATIRELVDAGKVFASCQERIDPRTPEGRYMLTAFLANGELFLDQAKASWKAAKRRAIKRGAPMGPTPIGYLRVKSPPAKTNQIGPAEAAALAGRDVPLGTIIPDPKTAPMIAEVFRRAAAGETPGEIAASLPEPDGRRPYNGHEVRRWLLNRFYLGEIRYGELSAVDSHEPLVDRRTFEAAQPGPARVRRRSGSLPLVGLLRCGNCGESMTGNRFGGSRHDLPVYRCGSRCGRGSVIAAHIAEGFVFDQIRPALEGFVLGGVSELGDLDAAVSLAEDELDAFVSNLTVRASLGRAKWERGVEVRAKALSRAQTRRDAAIRAGRFAEIDLSDPSEHDLRSFAFAVMEAVYVDRGRGPDRLRVAWAGDDGEA